MVRMRSAVRICPAAPTFSSEIYGFQSFFFCFRHFPEMFITLSPTSLFEKMPILQESCNFSSLEQPSAHWAARLSAFQSVQLFCKTRNKCRNFSELLGINEDYKSTHLYLILCQGHIYDYLTDEQFDELTSNLDFNDTKSLLLTEPIAAQFLDGYWTNDGGNKYIEFYQQGNYWNVHTNLDNSGTNWDNFESFFISEGIFGLEFPINKEKGTETINPNDEFEKKELFRITILGKDKIAVVILKDNSRYVLTKDK